MLKVITFCICLLFAGTGSAQMFVQAGAGVTTHGNAGADFSVGYGAKKTTFTVGYFALLDNDQPLLLNVQAGYKLTKAVRVYGGYVRKQVSANFKTLNSNSWITGIEYNTKRFKRGNFYYSANYIPDYFFVTVGMKFNYR